MMSPQTIDPAEQVTFDGYRCSGDQHCPHAVDRPGALCSDCSDEADGRDSDWEWT